MSANKSITEAIDAMTKEYLGKHGVIAIGDIEVFGKQQILVNVEGSLTEANKQVPMVFWDFKVMILPGAKYKPQ